MSLKLFLDYSGFREEWSVKDDNGVSYGCGDCPEEAIKSARVITNAPIYANSQYKGLIDGEPVLRVKYLDEATEDTVLYGAEELIETMAELGGFKAYKVYDDDHYLMGYTFEVIE
jgi:hypothetical protein